MLEVQLMTNAQKGVGRKRQVHLDGFWEGWVFGFPNGITVWCGSTER